MLVLPLRDQVGQQVFADCQAGGQPQRCGVFFGEQAFQLGCVVEQRQNAGQHRTAILIEHQTPTDAVKQFHRQRVLQLRQRGAGC